MDKCVLLTSTPSCVVSPRGDHSGGALVIARRGETTYSAVSFRDISLSFVFDSDTMTFFVSGGLIFIHFKFGLICGILYPLIIVWMISQDFYNCYHIE